MKIQSLLKQYKLTDTKIKNWAYENAKWDEFCILNCDISEYSKILTDSFAMTEIYKKEFSRTKQKMSPIPSSLWCHIQELFQKVIAKINKKSNEEEHSLLDKAYVNVTTDQEDPSPKKKYTLTSKTHKKRKSRKGSCKGGTMSAMTYKEIRIKQFKDLFKEINFTSDQMMVYNTALDFLSSTIEEILKCQPERKFRPADDGNPREQRDRFVHNNCVDDFWHNLQPELFADRAKKIVGDFWHNLQQKAGNG